ncbi:MAG: DUF4163 domain-containing protein [Robiginitalea sp.]|nr:DUF4163 domain-containing protein [Robiginitalea sp.]
MRKASLLLFLGLLIGCQSEKTIEMREREYTGTSCEACPVVRVTIPEIPGNSKLGTSINTALREEIIELLDYDEARDARDIPEAIKAFQDGFRKMQEEFPEELTGWEASVEAFKTYEDPEVLTIEMDTYIFTGGAHGYPATRYLNFSKKTGEELDAAELLKDAGAFTVFAEAAFRKQYGISSDAPINSTGFMFEDNQFRLPQNMGLTTQGMVLHYNPYEAASYADGALVLEFPLEAVRPFLIWEP